MKLIQVVCLLALAGCANSASRPDESLRRTTRDGHASFVLPAEWTDAGKGAGKQEWQRKRGEAVVATLEVIFIPLYADYHRRAADLVEMVGKDDPEHEYEVVGAGETDVAGAPGVTVRYKMGHGSTSVTGTNLFVLTREGAVEFKIVYWMGEPAQDVEREGEAILSSVEAVEAQ
ncbi:MAG: hypothetical protein FD180_2309 [Planctomycetota bacterium]|nr:MAG: hypothetical protein FD180_2309 [Planctomycetota bacterium]